MLATAIAAPKISVDTFAIFLLRDVIDAQKIGLLAANSNHTFLSIVLQSNPLMHFALGAADCGDKLPDLLPQDQKTKPGGASVDFSADIGGLTSYGPPLSEAYYHVGDYTGRRAAA
jgi:hypothetical protein